MEKKEKWIVKCRINGRYERREFVVKVFDNRDDAERWADILNEGAFSNPRSNAVYWVELKE